jgi:aquaporin Z
MSTAKKAAAEVIGTFWLTFGGCGAAVLAGNKIGFLGISIAFGLTVVTMAYAIGHVSGCHLNPAVSVGLVAAGKMPPKDLPIYIASQVVGAVLAAAVLMCIVQASGEKGAWEAVKLGGFASNGYGDPIGPSKFFAMPAALLAEVVLTFIFLFVILGATHKLATPGMAGLAIGLCLTLIHLVGIPIDNLSVNPARSTGPAVFVGGWAVKQLWLFWLAPIAGAALAGGAWRWLGAEDKG